MPWVGVNEHRIPWRALAARLWAHIVYVYNVYDDQLTYRKLGSALVNTSINAAPWKNAVSDICFLPIFTFFLQKIIS